MRGRFSCAPYSILSAPLREGGLDCPSLVHRCQAYDAKFIGDLISAPLDVPWKVWTLADLRQASLSSAAPNPSSWHPNPLTQHAFLTLRKLDPRVRQSIVTLRSLGYNIQCAFPSSEARADMPSLLHPMLPASLSTGSGVPLLRSIGASSVTSLHPRRWPRLLRAYESELSPSSDSSPASGSMVLDSPEPSLPVLLGRVAYVLAPPQRFLVPPDPPHIMPAQSGLFLGVDVPPHPSGWRLDPRHLPGHTPARVPRAPAIPSVPSASQRLALRRRAASILTALRNRDWSPDSHYPGLQSLCGDIRIWPSMAGAYGCARILTQSPSILGARSSIDRVRHNPRKMPPVFAPLSRPPPAPAQAAPAHYLSPVVTVWTDGSAVDNGLESCVAGAGWFSDSGVFAYARVVGPMVSNNVAEVSAVIMALQAWQSSHLHIYTDSTFVLGLIRGGLLAMERDGWPDLPLFKFATPGSLRTLFQNLLGLLRRHNSLLKFSWVKGHSGVYGNERADKIAALGVEHSHFVFSVSQPLLEPGWVDSAPVLNHQPLSHLTYLVVRDSTPPPLLGPKFAAFRLEWLVYFHDVFDTHVDLLRHFQSLWTINIPPGLRELLWKYAAGSLPLGHRWHGTSDLGRTCRCGSPMSLSHVWAGCPAHDLTPLFDLLDSKMRLLEYGTLTSLWPSDWPAPFWFPLIALKPLESLPSIPVRVRRRLGKSRRAREWALGSFFWYVWKQHMKEVMEPAFRFLPIHHVSHVRELLELPSVNVRHATSVATPPPSAAPLIEEVFTVSPLLHPRVRALRDTIMASTPVPDSPLRVAMDIDAPLPLYAPKPPTPLGVTVIHRPPTPPIEAHDSWCACSPCLAAQDELYGT